MPLIPREVHSNNAKEVVQILVEADDLKNHKDISLELERCLHYAKKSMTAKEALINELFILDALGNTSLIDFKNDYRTMSERLEIAIDCVARQWKIKELMCALEATGNDQIVAQILEWAKKLSQEIQKVKEEQANNHNVPDGNNNDNDNSTPEQIELSEIVRPGTSLESSNRPTASPVPSRDSGFGETPSATTSLLHEQSSTQEIASEDCNISSRKGEQELRFSDVVHKTTSNKLKLGKEIKSCIQQRKTLVKIQLKCDRVKRVNKFVQVIDKFFRHSGPWDFPLLRVVKLNIKTDKIDKLKCPSPQLIESLFFFLPDFSSKNLVDVALNEIFIKINGRVYVNVVKTDDGCSLMLHKLKIFSPQQFLTDPKLNLVSLSCMLLSVPLKLLQNCVSLKELNLNNCYYPHEAPTSSSKDSGTEEYLKSVAKEMTGTLAKLPNLKELVIDMGNYKGHFDLSVLPQLRDLEKLAIGHCVLDEPLAVDVIRDFNGEIILYNCEFSNAARPEFIDTDYDPSSTIIYLQKGKEPRLESTTYNKSNICVPAKRATMTVGDEKKWFNLFKVERFVDFDKSPFRREL